MVQWVCIGRSDGLGELGAQRAVAYASKSFLLVRGRDDALRVFENSCRHRGHELLEVGGEQTRKAIRCPYHSWLYDLDGALKQTSRFGDLPGVLQVRLSAYRGTLARVARLGIHQSVGRCPRFRGPCGKSRCVRVTVGAGAAHRRCQSRVCGQEQLENGS